jgi:hypothetical protein
MSARKAWDRETSPPAKGRSIEAGGSAAISVIVGTLAEGKARSIPPVLQSTTLLPRPLGPMGSLGQSLAGFGGARVRCRERGLRADARVPLHRYRSVLHGRIIAEIVSWEEEPVARVIRR